MQCPRRRNAAPASARTTRRVTRRWTAGSGMPARADDADRGPVAPYASSASAISRLPQNAPAPATLAGARAPPPPAAGGGGGRRPPPPPGGATAAGGSTRPPPPRPPPKE